MRKIQTLILLFLVIFFISCHSTIMPPDEPESYRIVKNDNNKYWIEIENWTFDGIIYAKNGWVCMKPCVHFSDQKSAEKELDEILKNRKITIIKTVLVK